MHPIYFPHTYIADETFQALTACFRKITVYQPTLRHIPESMIQWRNTDQLEIRCPLGEFETDIESSLKSYQHLGDIHQGRTGEVKHFQPAGIPFFDDTSPQKIRADLIREIRGDALGKKGFAHSAAKLIHAGLFLQMAQNLDAHQDEIGRNMAACAGMEKNLFKNLKEDDDLLFQELVSSPLPSADSPGEHRLRERFSAWTRLFLYDISTHYKEGKCPSSPLLFITTSRFLFDAIVTDGTDNTSFFSLDPHRLGQPTLVSTLTEMARTTNLESFRETLSPVVNETPMAIKTAVVLNDPPLAFLAKQAGLLIGNLPKFPDRELQPNTLIALLSAEAKGL